MIKIQSDLETVVFTLKSWPIPYFPLNLKTLSAGHCLIPMDRIAKRSGLARYIKARQLDGSRFRIMDIGENLDIEPQVSCK